MPTFATQKFFALCVCVPVRSSLSPAAAAPRRINRRLGAVSWWVAVPPDHCLVKAIGSLRIAVREPRSDYRRNHASSLRPPRDQSCRWRFGQPRDKQSTVPRKGGLLAVSRSSLPQPASSSCTHAGFLFPEFNVHASGSRTTSGSFHQTALPPNAVSCANIQAGDAVQFPLSNIPPPLGFLAPISASWHPRATEVTGLIENRANPTLPIARSAGASSPASGFGASLLGLILARRRNLSRK